MINRLHPTLYRVSARAGAVLTALVLAAGGLLHAQTFQLTDMGLLGGPSTTTQYLASRPNAINSAQQVVGGAGYFQAGQQTDAFVWDQVLGTQNLGDLGFGYSIANAINTSGQIAGESFTADGAEAAVLWDSAGIHNIDTLHSGASFASAINKKGQIVGTVLDNASGTYHAFIWDVTNGVRDIGTLGGGQCSATSINSAGQVTGWSLIPGDQVQHAFVWDQSHGLRDLGTLPGFDGSNGVTINDAGQVIGEAYLNATGDSRTFVWDATHGLQDISPGRYSFPKGINNAGQALFYGFTDDQTAYHSFIWSSVQGVTDLGTFGADNFPEAINNGGQVVGSCYTPGYAARHAFLWDPTHGMQDLGALSGGTDSIAWCISDTGGIAGQSNTGTGEYHGIFLAVQPIVVASSGSDRNTAVQQAIAALLPSGDKDTDKGLQKALDSLAKSMDPTLWVDGNHLTAKDGGKFFDAEKQAVQALTDLTKGKKTPAGVVSAAADAIAKLATLSIDLATTAVSDAAGAGGDTKKLADANTALTKASASNQAGKTADAIDQAKQAWQKATDSLKK